MDQEIDHPPQCAGAPEAGRVMAYLLACGVPLAMARAWTPQIIAEASTAPAVYSPYMEDNRLSAYVRIAQEYLSDWLTETLRLPSEDCRLLAAQAALPEWRAHQGADWDSNQARQALRQHCILATPAPAPLTMPTHPLPLRSPRRAFMVYCKQCAPWSRRFMRWLRKL